MSGLVSYLKGEAGEGAVERHYLARGAQTVARRWNGAFGEIDLIFRHGDETVFVEVKSSSCFGRAFAALGARQIKRLINSALDFAGTLPGGQDSHMRFDVAAVDASGRVEIIENAICA